MRTVIALLFTALLSLPARTAEFATTWAYRRSEYGVGVKTDCKINWQDLKSGKTYCISKEEARQVEN